MEDIKIAGSDLGEGLRAMTPFIALMAGPLGAQLGATVGGALGVTSAVGQQARPDGFQGLADLQGLHGQGRCPFDERH